MPTNGGIKNLSDSHLYSYSVRDIISYTNSYKDFEYKILAGNEIYSLEGNNYSNWLFGFNPDLLTSQSIDMSSLQEGVNGYNGRVQNLDGQYAPSYAETLSYFGTASITIKTYDLFGSIRLDQTNLLTNSNKFRNNPSWSIGGKWNIKNENFFKADFVNQLNLRASYGLTGNIDKTTGPDIVTEATSDYNKSLTNKEFDAVALSAWIQLIKSCARHGNSVYKYDRLCRTERYYSLRIWPQRRLYLA